MASACLVAGGVALLVGEEDVIEMRDLAALYWLVTASVLLRVSVVFVERT